MRPGTSLLLVGLVAAMVTSVDVVQPPLAFGSIAGRGRGDWKPASVGAIPNASKHIHYRFFGVPAWANSSVACAFGSELDFMLPAHK